MASVWALGTCPLALLQGSLWPFFFLLHVARLRLLNDGQALLYSKGDFTDGGGRLGSSCTVVAEVAHGRVHVGQSLACFARTGRQTRCASAAARGDGGGAATVAEYLEHGAH